MSDSRLRCFDCGSNRIIHCYTSDTSTMTGELYLCPRCITERIITHHETIIGAGKVGDWT